MGDLENLIKYHSILSRELLIDFMTSCSSDIFNSSMKPMNSYVTDKNLTISKFSELEWLNLDEEMVLLNIKYFLHYVDLDTLKLELLYNLSFKSKFDEIFNIDIYEYTKIFKENTDEVNLWEWFNEDRGTSNYSLYTLIEFGYLDKKYVIDYEKISLNNKRFYILPNLNILYTLINDFKFRNDYLRKLGEFNTKIESNKQLFSNHLESNLNQIIDNYEESSQLINLPLFKQINMSKKDIKYILLANTYLKEKTVDYNLLCIVLSIIDRLKKYPFKIDYKISIDYTVEEIFYLYFYLTVEKTNKKIRIRFKISMEFYSNLEIILEEYFNQIDRLRNTIYYFELQKEILPETLKMYKHKSYTLRELFDSEKSESLLRILR